MPNAVNHLMHRLWTALQDLWPWRDFESGHLHLAPGTQLVEIETCRPVRAVWFHTHPTGCPGCGTVPECWISEATVTASGFRFIVSHNYHACRIGWFATIE